MSRKVVKTFFTIVVVVSLVLITVGGFIGGFDYVRSQDERLTFMRQKFDELDGSPVNENTPGAVEVELKRAASIDDIASELKAKGLIKSEFMYKLLSKFNGFNDKYQAGAHYLLPDMSYDEIMFMLTRRPEPVIVTLPEGLTYKQVQQKLLEAGLKIDVDYMDSLVARPNKFLDYKFIRELPSHKERRWPLQGYLWPDTYQFDANMDEEAILRMMLDNTEAKLSQMDEYKERAEQKGMTMDEVITLASVVQAESQAPQMNKIARVFMNRMDHDMPLQSDATINFLRLENGEESVYWASDNDLSRFADNPYNTYSHNGLPPGPINNPSTVAIEAVLWPATERTWPGASSYLYFCADGEGGSVFSYSLEEHEENVAYYSQKWQ